jgi:hypothetical protein
MKYFWTIATVLALASTLVWAQATAIWNFSFIEVTSRKYVTRLSNREHLGGLADAAKELLQKQQQDNPVLVAAAKVVIDVHDNLLLCIPCLFGGCVEFFRSTGCSILRGFIEVQKLNFNQLYCPMINR